MLISKKEKEINEFLLQNQLINVKGIALIILLIYVC